jgi:hypothetical protein
MEKVRISLLAVIFISVFFILGRIILVPTVSKSTITHSALPKAILLPE